MTFTSHAKRCFGESKPFCSRWIRGVLLYTWFCPQPVPSLSQHEAQIGGPQAFSCNNQEHMSLYLLQSECEDKIRLNRCMAHEDHARNGFVFVCVVGINANSSPKLSPMADNTIRRGDISGVYLGLYLT